MSAGPQEYGSTGEVYYPEPLNKFLGEVRAPKVTVVEKSTVTQSALGSGVIATASAGDVVTASLSSIAAAGSTSIVVTIAGYTPAVATARHRVFLSPFYGGAGSPNVYVSSGLTNGQFTITIYNCGSVNLSGTMTIAYMVI